MGIRVECRVYTMRYRKWKIFKIESIEGDFRFFDRLILLENPLILIFFEPVMLDRRKLGPMPFSGAPLFDTRSFAVIFFTREFIDSQLWCAVNTQVVCASFSKTLLIVCIASSFIFFFSRYQYQLIFQLITGPMLQFHLCCLFFF